MHGVQPMPDTPNRLFEVACKGCQRTLVTVERIRDPEIAVLVDHLRACSPSEPLGKAPMLGEVMACVRVGVVPPSGSESTSPGAE